MWKVLIVRPNIIESSTTHSSSYNEDGGSLIDCVDLEEHGMKLKFRTDGGRSGSSKNRKSDLDRIKSRFTLITSVVTGW